MLSTDAELEFAKDADEATLVAFFDGIRSDDREAQKRTVEAVWHKVNDTH
jgi:hypothetical protein